jgi:hypothetical protein
MRRHDNSVRLREQLYVVDTVQGFQQVVEDRSRNSKLAPIIPQSVDRKLTKSDVELLQKIVSRTLAQLRDSAPAPVVDGWELFNRDLEAKIAEIDGLARS